jgi:hypothetical protein
MIKKFRRDLKEFLSFFIDLIPKQTDPIIYFCIKFLIKKKLVAAKL